MNLRKLFTFFCAFSAWVIVFAQAPMAKIDLNMEGRNESEVNEPGYTSWYVARVHTASKTVNGVTFTLTATGPNTNSAFRASWNKALVQSPYYMKLVNDGLKIDNDTLLKYPKIAASFELTISGLPVGTHTLQTFHNIFEDTTKINHAPMNVYLNNQLIFSRVRRSVLVKVKSDATVLMTSLNVTEAGKNVVLRFEADTNFVPVGTKTKDLNVCINGFELNTDDASKVSNTPFPGDRDFHVNGDTGFVNLGWLPARNGYAKTHTLYFGTDSVTVSQAVSSNSSICRGSFPLDSLHYKVENLYNLNTYYWRVDETDSSNVVTKGAVWSFRVRHLAFPEAEGYGRDAIGGRGGKVVYVTNLNDDGPGSFREAVTSDIGPRTVMFAVSGLITLNSRLIINKPYITVAGQTAPGKGVCFRWAPIGVTGGDLIVQNLRLRLGIGITYDGMGLTGANHSIIDHCSISWTIDEAFSSRGAKNITLQNTLISEALNVAGHSNYPDGTAHGYAGSVGGDVGSLHHNFLAHCQGRNWSMAGGLDGNGYYSGKLDIFNMVVYNWGGRATDGGANQVNFVGNYYKKGPSTTQPIMLKADLEGTGKGFQSYYYSGNIEENTNGTLYCNGTDNTCARSYTQSNGQILDWTLFVDKPFFPSYATITSAGEAYKSVLSDVGCNQPVLDDHDKRVIQEALTGTTTYKGSRTGKLGIPDHESDVGSWENYPGYTRASGWDSDLDGLPDWWETAIGSNPNSTAGNFGDSNADADHNGYTQLEEFLHWIANPHFFIQSGKKIDIDLSAYTKGFSKQPTFTVTDIVNGNIIKESNSSVVSFTPKENGLGGFTFTVTDSEGTKLTRTIGIYSGEIPADIPFNYTYYLDRAQTKQITVSPSGIKTLKENESLPLTVFPNPAIDVINILYNNVQNSVMNVSVYNVAGVLVQTEKSTLPYGTQTIILNISKLPKGVYSLQINNNSDSQSAGFVKY